MEKMSRGRAERAEVIEALRKRFEASQGGVVADYRGLDVEAISELRAKFRENDTSFKVVKNTLTRLAVKGTGYESLDECLAGPTAVAFSDKDAIATARVAVEFAKEHEAFQVKGGFMEGGVLSAAEVDELSKLGGRDELLAQLLSVFNAPAQRLLGVLQGVPQKMLGVLQARADELDEGA